MNMVNEFVFRDNKGKTGEATFSSYSKCRQRGATDTGKKESC